MYRDQKALLFGEKAKRKTRHGVGFFLVMKLRCYEFAMQTL